MYSILFFTMTTDFSNSYQQTFSEQTEMVVNGHNI